VVQLSYRLCHHSDVTQRDKRSVSLPAELAKAIDEAAAASGSTFSAWIAETASHRLRLEAGRRGVAAWEDAHGPVTEQELAEGLAVPTASVPTPRLGLRAGCHGLSSSPLRRTARCTRSS
jgi:hypothetical protein